MTRTKLSIKIAAVVVLIVLVVSPASVHQRPALAHAHPLILAAAEETPGALIGVIIQKTGLGTEAEDLVTQYGGVITRDLSIIHAFAAQMTATDAVQLAQSSYIRWISPDARVIRATNSDFSRPPEFSETDAYVKSIGATQLWTETPDVRGEGVTVAIIDSGINTHPDLRHRIVDRLSFSSSSSSQNDFYGHGTHIAGIVAGNGFSSRNPHYGVAPYADLVSIKVSDNTGAGLISDVVAGLQWVYDNHDAYNIRVVNISLNSSVAESYHTSPLDAAIEILWFNQIVVVVSAGNNGEGIDNGILYPPANDPFAVVVGAVNDMGTAATGDDILADFSAFGTTESGFAKPDLVAPGTNIVSLLSNHNSLLAGEHADHIVDGSHGGHDDYFSMSGTSMASAVTTGAVALLLQDEPELTPDQVKYRLMATASSFGEGNGAGYLNIYNAVHGNTTGSANTGIEASQLLWSGDEPVTWDSVSWNSVSWNSVSWNSVSWNSVSWNSVSWNSVYWEP